MEEVYQYMMQKHHMHLLGCTKGKREAYGRKQPSLSFATVSLSFVMLHYKLNFPFKVQHPRNKNIALKRGLYLARGGTILATESCL